MMMIKQTAQLYNYERRTTTSGLVYYVGYINDDSANRFNDGQFIHTSEVVKETNNLVETLNTVYELIVELEEEYDEDELMPTTSKQFVLSDFELTAALGALGEYCPSKEHNDRLYLYLKIEKELQRRNLLLDEKDIL